MNAETMTDKPAPCPHCGSFNVKLFIGLSEIHDGEVHCENCGATSGNHPTGAEALTAWNARTVQAELVEALRDARTTISITRTNVMSEIGRCADPSESRWAGVPEQLAKRIAAIDAAITRATGAAS